MRERRQREWLMPFVRSLTKQTARKAPSLRVVVKSGTTAKGGAVPSAGRCDPRADAGAPRGQHPRRCPIPTWRGPSGNALGRNCVALLGIVDQATTCVVRLVSIPILTATRSTEDLFRASLAGETLWSSTRFRSLTLYGCFNYNVG